jgi:hypothetical protein
VYKNILLFVVFYIQKCKSPLLLAAVWLFIMIVKGKEIDALWIYFLPHALSRFSLKTLKQKKKLLMIVLHF